MRLEVPILLAGDLPGHPFRGNQYVGEQGSAADTLATQAVSRQDRFPSTADDPAPGKTWEYHATRAKNLDKIIQNGLTPGKGNLSTAPHLNAATFYGDLVDLSDRGPSEQAVLLRMPRARVNVGYPNEQGVVSNQPTPESDQEETREHVVRGDVPANLLQVYHKGEWVDLIKNPEPAIKRPADENAGVKTFRTMRHAANELQAIRNDFASSAHDPIDQLSARVDAVGKWAAAQKNTKFIGKLLEEAHQLHDRLHGGSGKPGLRIQMSLGIPITLAGDLPGHPFRGNQYASVAGDGNVEPASQDHIRAIEDLGGKLGCLAVDADANKVAYTKGRKELLKTYQTDPRVRNACDVLSAFTQGNFQEVRQIANQQAKGTYGATVAAGRASRLKALSEGNTAYGSLDGTNFGNPMGQITTVDKKNDMQSMSYGQTNQAVANLQDAIATSPVYEQTVYRGMSFSNTEAELRERLENGDFTRRINDGQKPDDGWEPAPPGKYGYAYEHHQRPTWDELVSKAPFKPGFKVGQTITLPAPTSFSRDEITAQRFAAGTNTGGGNKEGNGRKYQQVIQVEDGVHGLHCDVVSPWRQKEFCTNGQFVVTKIDSIQNPNMPGQDWYKSGVTREVVHVKQVGVFAGNPAKLPPAPDELKAYGTQYRALPAKEKKPKAEPVAV